MPAAYASLGMLKGDARMPDRNPGSSSEAAMVRYLERAALEIERRTGRRFSAQAGATRYYSGNPHDAHRRDLWIDDFAAITSVSVDAGDDGTYELALVEGTDYVARREGDDSANPIVCLELLTRGTQLAAWPSGQRAIKIVGTFGYSNESEAVVGEDGTAVTGTLADASDISLALSVATHGVTPGDTLIIESEQVYVAAKINDLAVRVVWGANGTTAAAHAAAAVSRRRYPRDIEAACVMRAADLARGAQSGWSTAVGDEGGFQSRTSFAQFMGLIGPYVRPVVR